MPDFCRIFIRGSQKEHLIAHGILNYDMDLKDRSPPSQILLCMRGSND